MIPGFFIVPERIRYKRAGLTIFLVLMFLIAGVKISCAAIIEPELFIVAPQPSENNPLQAGETIIFTILFTNSTPSPISIRSYERIGCRLVRGNTSLEVTAMPVKPIDAGRDLIAGNGFLKLEYLFNLPWQMSGYIAIELIDHKSNIARFQASVFDRDGTDKKDTTDDQEGELVSLEEKKYQFQPFLKNLSSYKPVYFLFGADPGIQKTSYQISFKYRLFDFKENSFIKENLGFMEKIHLGYTQQSFWDLKSDSAPFQDSRYMPEFFFLEDKIDLKIPWISGLGFQAGFQHESNGRGGLDSRSTNFGYFQPIITFHLWDETHFKFSPKAWVYLGNDNTTNPDLSDYRGYFDIETKIGNPLGLALGTNFRYGKKGATWQLDLTYPINQMPLLNGILDVYLHAQYFSGYAENLLEYNKRDDIFRLGFSIVR
jgi:phospholipase A1